MRTVHLDKTNDYNIMYTVYCNSGTSPKPQVKNLNFFFLKVMEIRGAHFYMNLIQKLSNLIYILKTTFKNTSGTNLQRVVCFQCGKCRLLRGGLLLCRFCHLCAVLHPITSVPYFNTSRQACRLLDNCQVIPPKLQQNVAGNEPYSLEHCASKGWKGRSLPESVI